jgi:hypothetical protein
MSTDPIQSELEKLRAENEALKRGRTAGLSFKVSEKGAVSVYGLGRFPVTLYREQWEKLLGAAESIRSFVADNADKLKVKG